MRRLEPLVLISLFLIVPLSLWTLVQSRSSWFNSPSLTPPAVTAQESECDEGDTNNWCQLQHNPRRTGYSPNNIDLPISNAWAFGFAQSNLNRGRKPERLHPQTQPIVYQGSLFIGTEMGTFYAFDAASGAILWEYNNDGNLGSVIGTAGAQSGRVFFASMDSKIYGLSTQTGQVEWIFDSGIRAGFSTSVLLAEDKVFVAHRSGTYFALNQVDGSVAWQINLPASILMSSAYLEGRLYVGANNLVVYALNSRDGSIVWETPPNLIHAAAFKDYWPMIHNGYVFIRPLKLEGGTSGTPRLLRTTGLYDQASLDVQQQIIDTYINNPNTKNLFVFEALTGQEVVMPHYVGNTMNGATCPPTLDADGWLTAPALWNDVFGSGWSRLDTTQKRIREVLWDGIKYSSNPDENLCTSGAGRLIFISHVQEGNVAGSWTWHLDRRVMQQTPAYHADNNYFFSNTQGAGTTPSVIAGGYIYHTTQNTLNARKATVLP